MAKEKIFSSFGLMPKEEMLEVKPNFKQLQIGIPKESSFQENRVSLTPDSVGLLVANGHSRLARNIKLSRLKSSYSTPWLPCNYRKACLCQTRLLCYNLSQTLSFCIYLCLFDYLDPNSKFTSSQQNYINFTPRF